MVRTKRSCGKYRCQQPR